MKQKKQKEINEQLVMQGVPIEKGESIFAADEKLQEPENNVYVVSEGQMSVFDEALNEPLGETLLDEDIVRDRLHEAIENQKPKKKKKSIITNLIFLGVNLFVLIFIISSLVKETEGFSLSSMIAQQGSKLWWLAGALGLVVLYFVADTLIINTLIKKSTGKGRLGLAYKTSITGRYFDDITPFSVGGEPAQIIALSKGGIAPGVATSIPLIKFVLYTMVYSVFIFCFLVFGGRAIPTSTPLNNLILLLLKIFAYLGLCLTALVSVIYTLIGSGKIVGRSLISKVVRFGYKIKIVKDFRVTYNKIMKTVLEYQSSFKYLRKNLGIMLVCGFLCLIEMLALFGMPYMIVRALAPAELVPTGFMLVIICITKSIICQMASVVIPLPGGTGMMEVSFIALFYLALGPNVVWGLLIWRFLTYYFNIIQGFAMTTIDNVRKIAKAKKEQKSVTENQVSIEQKQE